MSSSSEKTALPLALLLCAAATAGAQEPPACVPQRLVELAAPTQVDGTQSFALTPPAAGDYVLTLERDADAPKAKVDLGGQSLINPSAFSKGLGSRSHHS